ncbi:MAG: MBL fold metallo-hydrolase [Gemmatimonadota bacterium]|nr:MBL fold metallo-hydrolase [Gemmatimonadota bacterium]MDH3369590.1 MBL fold metallo-hydrolase [Gemmatimonadota bacterium]MDH3478814.1 MBL fold metallo-hydrolase [Gemmatimonadota bacterium]MDH3571735.1 MBL fold metallo-hydrolase [Gemmatimonadota bacterium]MDH5550063.1 MBL fold metallo-hydrolase [Gemmatimonadota bacterium]
MTTVEIIPIALGFDTCYVLKAGGVIAIDAGAPHKGKSFVRGLERAGIQPEEVKLIVLTHGHWDHIGSARDLKSLTGAELAMHELDVPCVEQSLTPLPPGVTRWGQVFIAIHKLFMPLIRVPSTNVEHVLGNDGLSLTAFGIPGRVLHTPGHSAGSVSVLLDGGEAFVGDLAMNKFPLRLSPGLPIFAEDLSTVVESWKVLLAEGATTIYPAHGKPFPVEVIRRAIGVYHA